MKLVNGRSITGLSGDEAPFLEVLEEHSRLRRQAIRAVATIGAWGARPPTNRFGPPPMILVTIQFKIAIAKIFLLNGRFDSYAKMYLYVLLYSFTYFSRQNTDRGINQLITQFTQCE